MKTLSLVVGFCFALLSSNAQHVAHSTFTKDEDVHFTSGKEKHDHKPQLIKSFTKKTVSNEFLNQAMTYRLHQQVTIRITDNLTFNGKVTAITKDAPGLQTVIMQSSEIKGLVLSISRLTQPNAAPIFRGIMMSQTHKDLLMMEKDPITGYYAWNKKNVSNVLTD